MAIRAGSNLFRGFEGDRRMIRITSLNVFVALLCLPALAQQETIDPTILYQLQQLDGGYKTRWYREAMLYRRSFQQTLREIEIALGEQGCFSDQLLVSQLIAEFNPDETTMARILEMNQEIGLAIVSCN